MTSAQKRNTGVHAQFVVAVILAAGAGFLWGSMREEKSMEESRNVASSRERRERPRAERASNEVEGKFVQALLEGTVGERQQWQHIRSFTEAEVKEALADMDKVDRYLIGSWELRPMLYYRWAEHDPVAANATARKEARDGPFADNFSNSRKAVIAAWVNQGGAVAAWEAVRDEHEVWACTRTVPGEVADMVVASLSDREDMAAMKEALRFNDEEGNVAGRLVETRAGRAVDSPESRAAFLAAAEIHPDPWIMDSARELLFKEWAKKDVAEARTGLLALSLDEESRESLGRVIDRVEEDKAREAGEEP